MKFLRSFAQFWYDFIIGDDWKIAAAVVSSLVILYLVMSVDVLGDHALSVLGGLLVVTAFGVSLAIDVRAKS